MYRIGKKFEFAASHQLTDLPLSHKCSRMHGHNYVVELILEAEELDEFGFVVDYGDLKPFKNYIDSTLDHRNLNATLGSRSTAENLARFLWNVAEAHFPDAKIVCVRTSETPNTFAEYYGF